MIDNSVYVHKSSFIDKDVSIGSETKIWHFSHVQSGASIGSNCTIGQNVNISNNVLIGNYVKNLDEFYQILYYMVSMIFIQPYSYAYHLIYLVIVFLYFVFKCDKFISKVFIFPIILLMIPKEYGLIDIGQAGIGKTQLSGLINPIIILFTYYSIFTLKEKK